MIREITSTLDTFIGSFTGYLNLSVSHNPVSTAEKINKVVALIFIAIVYSLFHYAAPNLCVFGLIFGLICGRKTGIQDSVQRIIDIWHDMSLPQNLLTFAGAYFGGPLVVSVGSFLAFAAVGDHLYKATGKVSYDLGWKA